jgi:hypothetical protein
MNEQDEREFMEITRMMAKSAWTFYKELLSQGFSETQALRLTCANVARRTDG